MKAIKKDQHFTAQVEFTEAEVQSLVGLFEEVQALKQMPYDDIKGLRGDIYKTLKSMLANPL